MAAIIDECEHIDEQREQNENYYANGGETQGGFCGEFAPHGVHDNCWGLMCDYGCNAGNF